MSWLSALFGDNSSASGTSNSTSTTKPTYSGAAGGLNDLVLRLMMTRLSNPTSLTGYEGTGVSRINRSYELARQGQQNALVARGLGTSPIAGNVDATRENARAGDVATFRNSIPLTERALENENLGLAGSALAANRAFSTTGTNTSDSSGGSYNLGLGSILGSMMASGAFGGGGGAGGAGGGGGFGGGGSLLSMLLGLFNRRGRGNNNNNDNGDFIDPADYGANYFGAGYNAPTNPNHE
jgi:hypothetical protein